MIFKQMALSWLFFVKEKNIQCDQFTTITIQLTIMSILFNSKLKTCNVKFNTITNKMTLMSWFF